MTYSLLWSERAKEDLELLSSTEAMRIVKKVKSYLVKDPISLGKPLSGNLSGLYRYRIGDYRVLYQVIQNKLLITVVAVGHRKDVYE